MHSRLTKMWKSLKLTPRENYLLSTCKLQSARAKGNTVSANKITQLRTYTFQRSFFCTVLSFCSSFCILSCLSSRCYGQLKTVSNSAIVRAKLHLPGMTSYSTLLHFPRVHISLHQRMSEKENQKFHEKKNQTVVQCLRIEKFLFQYQRTSIEVRLRDKLQEKNYCTQKSCFAPVGLVRRSIYHVPFHQKGCLDVTSYPSPVNQSEMKHDAEHKP